jgi:flagellar biosynthetic protein FlhB
MADGPDQDKSEPATGKKRKDARKKGQVARSREIPSVAILLCTLSVFYFSGGWMLDQLGDIMKQSFNHLVFKNFSIESAHLLLWDLFLDTLFILAPFLAVVIVAGIVSNVAQTGWMLSGETLTPKLDKLNPINGMKSLVSLRSMVEVIKSVIKIIIVGAVAHSILSSEMDQIPGLVELETSQILALTGSVSLRLGFYTCLALIVMAGIDYIFQHWQHERDLKMTKQEVQDEHKQQEGDPKVKSRIRAIQREMAMQRMMESVPGATVVITNPTHLAVALKFERSMPAPKVVAKGAGHIAEKIKALAKENDVPIIEEKPLARALFKNVDIDQYIPADLYHAVAEMLAYVYRLKGLAH